MPIWGTCEVEFLLRVSLPRLQNHATILPKEPLLHSSKLPSFVTLIHVFRTPTSGGGALDPEMIAALQPHTPMTPRPLSHGY